MVIFLTLRATLEHVSILATNRKQIQMWDRNEVDLQKIEWKRVNQVLRKTTMSVLTTEPD